jgi:hypothetical protein
METRKIISTLFISILVAAIFVAPGRTQADENAAKSILKSMSDYIGSQKTIEFTFDSGIEIITPQLEKIQFTNSGEARVNRPNKLWANRIGGHADVTMFYDGETVSVYGKHINGYFQADAPASIDELVHALREGHGVSLPGADLLLSDSYTVLSERVMEAKYIGRSIIGGKQCDHLAFRNFDTDWQIWVEVGEKPIPRRMVITSKTMNSAPQYTVDIRNWKTSTATTDESFVFSPPAGAKKLSDEELIELDELPPGLPEGGKQ